MSAPTRKCGVSSCKYHHNPAAKGSDVYFFKIPSVTTEYGKKWVAALKTMRTKFFGSHVCSLHFNCTDIEEYDTSTKGEKYVILRRGAVPRNRSATPPAEEALCNPQLKETVRVVDIEAIKKSAGAQNIADEEIPLEPLIIQPQLSTQSSSIETSSGKSNDQNNENKSQQTHLQQLSSCVQCKIYKEKWNLAEKRCQQLEETIRVYRNSVNTPNGGLLDVSMMTIENCTPAEDSTSMNFIEKEETLSDNDDASNSNDNDYMSTEMLSDNDYGLDSETMDLINSETLKIMEPTQSQSSVAGQPRDWHNIGQTIRKAEKVNEIKEHHKRSTKTEDSETRPVKTVRATQTAKLKPFKCAHCNECFTTSNEITLHMNRVHFKVKRPKTAELKPFKCVHCNECFKTSNEITMHMNRVHDKAKSHECYICKEKCKSLRQTQIHLRQHIRGGKCTVPPRNLKSKDPEAQPTLKTSPSQSRLTIRASENFRIDKQIVGLRKRPKKRKTADLKPCKCTDCNECFKTSRKAAIHMKRVHDKSKVRTFECYICREKFISIGPTKLHLKQHIRTECAVCQGLQTKIDSDEHVCSGLKSLSCVYCQQLFLTTKSLLQHLQECKSEKISYECGKCLKFFLMETLADLHRKTHEHGEQTRPFVCSTCSRGFYSRGGLKKHELVHSESLDYLCDGCGKGFNCAHGLYCHQREIHNKKAMKCPHCNVTSLGMNNHYNHMRRHQNIKFACNICGLQLVSARKLAIHKEIHTRTEVDRIYGCSVCDKKFFTKKASRSHFVNAHQPIRFECDLCNQSYKYKGDLNKHKRVVHAVGYSYVCPHCDKRFPQSYELNNHLFEHTEET